VDKSVTSQANQLLITPKDIEEFQSAVKEKTGRLLTPEEAENQLLKFLALEDLYKQFQRDQLENQVSEDNNGGNTHG
jgi:hypothetical protein